MSLVVKMQICVLCTFKIYKCALEIQNLESWEFPRENAQNSMRANNADPHVQSMNSLEKETWRESGSQQKEIGIIGIIINT